MTMSLSMEFAARQSASLATSSRSRIPPSPLRPLAVSTSVRAQALPDVPTVGDFLPGYDASDWYGLCAPKSTAPEIIARLNTEINAGLADPKLKARLDYLGGFVLAGSPAEFGKLIAAREMGQGGAGRPYEAGVAPRARPRAIFYYVSFTGFKWTTGHAADFDSRAGAILCGSAPSSS